ncbi:C-type lectin BML-2-like [Clarias gariepinus]|uniref:C-type lectin BML-2-like n=1 Tax=Clarias gariepinus TaxID=13013 RepID=UPI00234C7C5F|nr:C-type lectin BML-2-like [Clarias gariepinus]
MDLKPFICYSVSSGGFVGITVTMSWWGGQTYCRKYHTDLASATTTTEISQLQQIVSVQGASWFGLFRDNWMWSDASSPLGIQWKPGFPNNADHNDTCGSVNNTGFVDKQCNSLFNFFCHTQYKVRYQVLKLHINGDESVFNSAVQSTTFQQIVQKLKEHGIWLETNVTWRVQSDGNILHKKLFDGL